MDITDLRRRMLRELPDLARERLGVPPAEITDLRLEPIGYTSGAVSTFGLWRARAATAGGADVSFVVKAIRAPRHISVPGIPAEQRDQAAARYPWRADLDAYLAARPLPPGLRVPRLFRVTDLGEDRLMVWMEDVPVRSAPWDLDRYGRAARLLGAMAELNPADGPDVGLRRYCEGPVASLFLPALRDPEVWRHPLVAEHADPLLRADLLALADRVPSLLAAADRLPHAFAHGDACPQNLLVPADGSAEFVAIDWGWPHPTAVGFDLGQLLVGLAHEGLTEPADLPAVHKTIEAAYTAAVTAAPDEVALGYAVSLVLRSAWTALPLDRLHEEPTPRSHDLFRRRAGLARFIADLGRSL
ncbi:phosphotransferase [Sphaerisporangium sp. TRM90804]|uniref:phosphotransferase n=1 Tax=Sphaerisporangium sp. TRM90804 TaxID=3031113 RepID=UPI00244A6EBB|nr:phosphotransferase [Sphaerisporangium sp. TRM90804]MDH2430500.1 phosphotransferase [Sphaerisporangium sp. TRM90804]